MTFSYTREQYQAMEGLAYRIADNAYMIERYGRDGAAVDWSRTEKPSAACSRRWTRSPFPFGYRTP